MSQNKLLDAFVRRQVYLQRFSANEAREFEKFRTEAERVIRMVLTEYDGKIPSYRLMERVIREIEESLDPLYSEWTETLVGSLSELATDELEFVSGTVARGTTRQANMIVPAVAQVISAAFVRPLENTGVEDMLGPFIRNFTQNEIRRVNNVIRGGFHRGETVSQMVRDIRGTRMHGYRDGVLATSSRNARVISRTSVNHMSTMARQVSFAQNDSLFEGVEWVSTLDIHTSNICINRDGNVYPMDEGPRPPAHPACRSTILPKVKSEYNLFSGTEPTRASSGSKGGGTTKAGTYYKWLTQQNKEFQDEVLGKKKAKLFRESGLSTEEFKRLTSNNMDEPLTLKEIREKNPGIWKDVFGS